MLEQQGGSFVLVVAPDDVVEARPVKLGVAHEGMQQITAGLAPGERVVADGVLKARPGTKVVAKELDAEAVATGAP